MFLIGKDLKKKKNSKNENAETKKLKNKLESGFHVLL